MKELNPALIITNQMMVISEEPINPTVRNIVVLEELNPAPTITNQLVTISEESATQVGGTIVGIEELSPGPTITNKLVTILEEPVIQNEGNMVRIKELKSAPTVTSQGQATEFDQILYTVQNQLFRQMQLRQRRIRTPLSCRPHPSTCRLLDLPFSK